MIAHRLSAAFAISVMLSACGASQDEPRKTMPVEDTVFGDTVNALDKARSVEATTLQHKAELDAAMEAAEGQ